MANERDEQDVIEYICRYTISTLTFTLDDEEIAINPTDLISITKFDNYDLHIRSMLKLSRRKKLWLIKNKRKIRCKIELNMVGVTVNEVSGAISDDVLIDQEEIFNMEFGVFFNQDEEEVDNGIANTSILVDEPTDENAKEDIFNENYAEFENYLDVYLFNLELLDPSNEICNEVYTKDTLCNIVAHMLTKSKHKKVVMSPFENDKVYNELLVPAHPMFEALCYLENYYGFYKTGGMIYYDLDTLYIVNTNGKLTAKQQDEWAETTILINDHPHAAPVSGMIRRTNEKINYIQTEEQNIQINKPSIIDNNVMGSDLTMVTTDGTELVEVKADQSYTNKRYKNLIYTKKDDNQFAANILEARKEENEAVIQITATNLDIRAFAPNKVFTLIFDNEDKQEKYGKWNYRIAQAYHDLRLEGSMWTKSTHTFILKKTGTDHEVEESNDDVE